MFLVICVLSFQKHLFLSFTHFYWVFCPILTDLEEFFIYSATNPLLSNFSLFVSCLVPVFMVVKKKINTLKIRIYQRLLYGRFFNVLFKMSIPPPNVIDILLLQFCLLKLYLIHLHSSLLSKTRLFILHNASYFGCC